jgi:hypothetical protein
VSPLAIPMLMPNSSGGVRQPRVGAQAGCTPRSRPAPPATRRSRSARPDPARRADVVVAAAPRPRSSRCRWPRSGQMMALQQVATTTRSGLAAVGRRPRRLRAR